LGKAQSFAIKAGLTAELWVWLSRSLFVQLDRVPNRPKAANLGASFSPPFVLMRFSLAGRPNF
jgi:hypothetical protein